MIIQVSSRRGASKFEISRSRLGRTLCRTFILPALIASLCGVSPVQAQNSLLTHTSSRRVSTIVETAPLDAETSWGINLGGSPSSLVGTLGGFTLAQLGLAAAVVGSAGIAAHAFADSHDSGHNKFSTSITGFETAEYEADWGLGVMKASSLYAQGATGKGVMTSMTDSGIRTTHQEFAGASVSGFETAGATAAGGNSTLDDPSGHGTHVAATMIGRKDGNGMHGVAYEATGIYVMESGDPGGGQVCI